MDRPINGSTRPLQGNAHHSRPLASPNPRQFQNNERPPAPPATGASRAVQQPKPQALAQKPGPSNILVNNRQKGNPILKEIKAQAYEFADIPADFVLGLTTCALFLSLKYHRLHPEYIYTRIRALQGRYNLRILLVMVDITNHEESLKELSKTSLVNNVTIILCWSAAEAGRYLELYKMYENAPATAIKAPQSTNHGDKLIEFITVPRSVNKTDALGLVSNFGSVRTAVNARPEEISLINGWGQVKVKHWTSAVSEPFRSRRAAKRATAQDERLPHFQDALVRNTAVAEVVDQVEMVDNGADARPEIVQRPPKRPAEDLALYDPDEDEEAAMMDAAKGTTVVSETSNIVPAVPAKPSKKSDNTAQNDGVLAALARLREQG